MYGSLGGGLGLLGAFDGDGATEDDDDEGADDWGGVGDDFLLTGWGLGL